MISTKSLQQHDFVVPIDGPSTPTSTSFRASRSDTSEVTNDTLPSSVHSKTYDGNPSSIPAPAESSTLQPTPQPSPAAPAPLSQLRSESTPVVQKHFVDVDPLHKHHETDMPVRPTYTQPRKSNKILNRIIDESTSSINHRRQTDPTDLSSVPNANSRPITRSTFPSYQSKASEVNSSTNSEILRMRNSIVVKRNFKKRKDFLEEDKVLVGNKISEGHENFVMAYNMLTGIRVAVSRCSGIMQKLTDADFTTTKKLTFSMDGSELTPSSKYDFKFKDYAPEVFRELRGMFGLDPADYLVSITGKYILSELGSPGKSGSFFYYSRDYRFIIKTIHHAEHKQLRRILKDYHKHVKENSNTLISQFYGLHRLKMPFINGSKKVHFIVMNNLFPPHRDIHLKYDLKGSTWGRLTRIPPDNPDLSQFTLKDLNFLESKDKIQFGPHKRNLFLEQLEQDVKFLTKINVMDYSLLFGIHDVKKGNSTHLEKLSVFDPKSSNKYELIKTNPRDLDRENDLPTNVYPGRSKYVFYGHDGGIRATDEDNNPLREIYYIGIIDCLTNYSLKKKLETFWRSLGHQRSTISALPSAEYGERFLSFLKDGVLNSKLKKN